MWGIVILGFLVWVVFHILNEQSKRYNLPSSQRRQQNTDFTQRPHWHDEVRNGSHYW